VLLSVTGDPIMYAVQEETDVVEEDNTAELEVHITPTTVRCFDVTFSYCS